MRSLKSLISRCFYWHVCKRSVCDCVCTCCFNACFVRVRTSCFSSNDAMYLGYRFYVVRYFTCSVISRIEEMTTFGTREMTVLRQKTVLFPGKSYVKINVGNCTFSVCGKYFMNADFCFNNILFFILHLCRFRDGQSFAGWSHSSPAGNTFKRDMMNKSHSHRSDHMVTRGRRESHNDG